MFNTVEEIAKNKYINDLVNEVQGFGMFGAYVHYKNAENPQNNGIYFISGYDPKIVMDKDTNIEKLYMEQSNTKTFRADLHITKLTDQSPFNCHQDIMRYCLHASTLRAIGNKVGFNKTFQNVSTSFVNLVEAYYLNSTDSNLSYADRKRNEYALQEFYLSEGAREFSLQGETGDGPDVHMRPEKLDKKIPNMVSLEDLTYRTLGTEQMVISYDMLSDMKKELAKNPKILFFQAKPVIARLNVPDNQGFGSKKANELSSVVLVYDVFYRKQVELMYLKTKYPQCFEYSVNDIKRLKGKETCSFGISLSDLETVFEKAKEAGIPICVDTKKLYFNCNKSYNPQSNEAGYTVTISKQDVIKMDSILACEAAVAKRRHILELEDIQKYSYNPSGNIKYGRTDDNLDR